MRILIPVAHYVPFNTARYVQTALEALGHEAIVITQAQFYQVAEEVHRSGGMHWGDLYFGVDSGGPLDFPEVLRERSCMWFIDSRRNRDPALRMPDDDTTAQILTEAGGWVFQAQKKDTQRNHETGVLRSTWLPLAADPQVWKPDDLQAKIYDVGFGGNVWCEWRGQMLERIRAKGWTLGQWTGHPEELSSGYTASRVGFNCSSFFGTDVAYDVNMRVFEVMACGIPLVTNTLPEMGEMGMWTGINCMTYREANGAMAQIRLALGRSQDWRDNMGAKARSWIKEHHTYEHRMVKALEVLKEAGIISAD